MSELSDIVKKRSPFLRLEGGESVVARYDGFKMIPSTYDPDKEIFRFIVQVNEDQKYWDTSSNKVAMVFDGCKKGDLVKITKSIVTKGGKESTAWDVVPVTDEKGDVTTDEAKEIEDQLAG